MKYVRTKDGIFEKANQTIYKNEKIEYLDGLELVRIIDQADAIKELCDEFVIKVKNNGYLLCPYEKALSLTEEAKQRDASIFGAIWTDKGLIFVARMNNERELELL